MSIAVHEQMSALVHLVMVLYPLLTRAVSGNPEVMRPCRGVSEEFLGSGVSVNLPAREAVWAEERTENPNICRGPEAKARRSRLRPSARIRIT